MDTSTPPDAASVAPTQAGLDLLELLAAGPVTAAIHAAVRIGIPDELANGPRTPTQLASATGAHVPSIARLLRVLASRGVFQEEDDGRFALTTMGDLLRRDVAFSLRAVAELGSARAKAWEHLARGVRSGQTTHAITFGAEARDHDATDPSRARTTDDASHALSRLWADAVIDAWDFGRAARITDLGGGSGALLGRILERHDGVRGVLLERPSVVRSARAHLEERSLASRVEVVEGDFFEEVPAGSDVYVLQRCLEEWADEPAKAILRACHRALTASAAVEPGQAANLGTTLPSGSARASDVAAARASRGKPQLVIVEPLVPRESERSVATLFDLDRLMLGGLQRTRQEMERLLQATGFTAPFVVATRSPLSLLVTSPR